MIFSCTTFVIQRTGKFSLNAAPRRGEIRPCPWCWGPTSRTPPRWPTAPGWPPPTSCSPPWCPPSSCAPPAASAGPPSGCTGRLACSWPGAGAAREAGRELREGHQPRRSEAVKNVINIIIISFHCLLFISVPGAAARLRTAAATAARRRTGTSTGSTAGSTPRCSPAPRGRGHPRRRTDCCRLHMLRVIRLVL